MIDKSKEGPPKKIRTESDIHKLNWEVVPGTLGMIDTVAMNVDFRDVPDELRPALLAELLTDGYERARRRALHNKKNVSQNRFAISTVGIDNQLYSSYKTMTRSPIGVNVDKLASYFGSVVYDILDLPARIPRDRHLARIAELWPRFDDRFRAELLERAENYMLNGDNENK